MIRITKEEQLTQRLEKQRSQILQNERPLSSKSDSLQSTPKSGLLTPGTPDLQKMTRHNLPESRLHLPEKAQRAEEAQLSVSDANVDGYLLDLRSEVTNLTKVCFII